MPFFDYGSLSIERAIFDLRRGLPVIINQEYFLWSAEFFDQDLDIFSFVTYIKPIPDKDQLKIDLVKGDYSDNGFFHLLVKLIKKTELLPQIYVTSIPESLKHKNLCFLDHSDLEALPKNQYNIRLMSKANVPTAYSQDTVIYAYRIIPGYYEAYAITNGTWSSDDIVPIRMHAECFTGDLLASLKCDCGAQLHKALDYFADQKKGVLLYLRQEGRNIGLLNKMRAYTHQDSGLDTVDANHILGFDMDERDYHAAALILKDLNIHHISMLTNNKLKVDILNEYDIMVHQRIAHYTPTNPHNHHYIQTKKDKMGHL